MICFDDGGFAALQGIFSFVTTMDDDGLSALILLSAT